MKIRIDHLTDSLKHFEFIEPYITFPVLDEISSSGLCEFCSPVTVNISAVKEIDHYRISGVAKVCVKLDCSRCLTVFDYFIESVFTFIFREESNSIREDEDELELEEKDLVSACFSGEEIDLVYEIGEQIALSIPLKPLCSEGCKGLCACCGMDLNHSSCNCPVETVNLRFSALKDFKVRS